MTIESKRVAFLSGLPRSGSTLLTALLSQRDDVYVSGLSVAADVISYAHLTLPQTEQHTAGETTQAASLLTHALDAMYADRPEPLIIDKSRMWGSPYYRRVLTQEIGVPLRILAPVRPLAEVVASFVRMCRAAPDNYIDRAMVNDDFYPYWRKPIDDARTDWLLLPNGHLGGAMLSLHGAYQSETTDEYCVIQYARLCDNTGETLREIERFLNLEPFDYRLDEIAGAPHNDAQVFGIPNMHHVRERIERIDPAPETILSPYAMARCELEDFWT